MIIIKRLCKNIDITDEKFILRAIHGCLKGKRSDRKDIQQLLKHYPDLQVLAHELSDEIKNRELKLKPIYYSQKIDGSSGKTRMIGVQDIKQQIYDYIAVMGLEPVFKRIGRYQCSAIKGRGQIYTKKAIKGMIQKPDAIYYYKADIKKYYRSVDRDKLVAFLSKRVKNSALLWLVKSLLDTFDSGLAIGSYLSQHLANLYMSILYHKLYEDCYYCRRGKRINYVVGAVFYMDDFVVFTASKKGLRAIDKLVKATIADMGLELKQQPQIERVDQKPIDMVGFVIYKDHTVIRKRIFLRARKAFRKFKRRPSVIFARKVIAYWGFFMHSDSFKLIQKYIKPFGLARRVISDKSTVRKAFATG